jgi:hypothetical protein
VPLGKERYVDSVIKCLSKKKPVFSGVSVKWQWNPGTKRLKVLPNMQHLVTETVNMGNRYLSAKVFKFDQLQFAYLGNIQ